MSAQIDLNVIRRNAHQLLSSRAENEETKEAYRQVLHLCDELQAACIEVETLTKYVENMVQLRQHLHQLLEADEI